MLEWLKRKIRFVLLTNKSFRLFRWLGVHVTPVHFYSPVPDIREFTGRSEVWTVPSTLPGIEMNDCEQRQLMRNVFAKYQPECHFSREPTPHAHEFFTRNEYFGYVSAVALHSMIRQFCPKRVIEVGAGHSSKVIARAMCLNAPEAAPAEFIAVDPFPNHDILDGLPGLSQLITRKIQEIDLSLLTSLQANDILSIDSSHTIRLGGDVVFLYLEVLPRLKPGVFVHIHDVFLPYNYPEQWLQQRYFWNEQYLLQAYLVGNSRCRLMWGQKYAETQFPEEYARAFGGRIDLDENFNSYSFWLQSQGQASERIET